MRRYLPSAKKPSTYTPMPLCRLGNTSMPVIPALTTPASNAVIAPPCTGYGNTSGNAMYGPPAGTSR